MLTRYRNSDPDDGLSSGGNSQLNIGCEKFFLQGYRGRMYFSSSFSYAHRKGGLKGSSLQSSSFECSNRWNRRKTLTCLEKIAEIKNKYSFLPEERSSVGKLVKHTAFDKSLS